MPRPPWVSEIVAHHANWRDESGDKTRKTFKRFLKERAPDLYERMTGWPNIHTLVTADVLADWVGSPKSLGPAGLAKLMPVIVERYQRERPSERFEVFVNRIATSGEFSLNQT